MIKGDISNVRSFCFGFRAENTLFDMSKQKLLSKLFNRGLSKDLVNKNVYSLMSYIYWNTEYTIMLVIDDALYQKSKDFLADFPFNQVCNIKSISEVTSMLFTGEMTYYIDNSNTRYEVQNKYTMTSDELSTLISRKYKGRLT